MASTTLKAANVNRELLRQRVADKYRNVALNPELGFHFHNGAPLARMVGYEEADILALPASVVESFAGTGNPFIFGNMRPGETVIDVGCGAGFDTLLAARQVGPHGRVIAVDMTGEMRRKAEAGARELDLANVQVLDGFAESLPAGDAIADAVISNGVVNLCPDKLAVFREMYRVLKPGGRMQVGDIVVHKEVPQHAKDDIDLWSG